MVQTAWFTTAREQERVSLALESHDRSSLHPPPSPSPPPAATSKILGVSCRGLHHQLYAHRCLQVFWNHVMEVMTGFKAKEALGRVPIEVLGFSEYVFFHFIAPSLRLGYHYLISLGSFLKDCRYKSR